MKRMDSYGKICEILDNEWQDFQWKGLWFSAKRERTGTRIRSDYIPGNAVDSFSVTWDTCHNYIAEARRLCALLMDNAPGKLHPDSVDRLLECIGCGSDLSEDGTFAEMLEASDATDMIEFAFKAALQSWDERPAE